MNFSFKDFIEKRYTLIANVEPLKVTIYQQINDYTCGPAALLTALSHFGDIPAHLNEQVLSEMMDTTKSDGTPNTRMVDTAKQLGVYANSDVGGNLKQVATELQQGQPVIVVYDDKQNSFHFVVILGIDNKDLVIADPWTKETRTLSRSEFEDRWYDSEGTKGWWMSLKSPSDT